ncbi:MAG: DHHA1 domain-containing protein, partial [Synechococcus sp.]|nr:DHHA1 domain-containing protein [Synechococcus sp.]
EDDGKIRGSARGIEEFNVFEALNYCKDLLGKFGGHRAAGGFSLAKENLEAFTEKLSEFAHQYLEPEYLKPLLKIDGLVNFTDLTPEFYQQIDQLHPWGIGNPEPIFWTKNVRILEQQTIGKNHLKFTLGQTVTGQTFTIKALAWQWADYLPLPSPLDVAYKLKENHWNGQVSLELELVGARPSEKVEAVSKVQAFAPEKSFCFNDRTYFCFLENQGQTLKIRNDQGKLLSIKKGQRRGKLGDQIVDVTQPPFFQMIKTAIASLEQSS